MKIEITLQEPDEDNSYLKLLSFEGKNCIRLEMYEQDELIHFMEINREELVTALAKL